MPKKAISRNGSGSSVRFEFGWVNIVRLDVSGVLELVVRIQLA